MGSSISIDVPVSAAQKATLEAKYLSLTEAGMTPRRLTAKFAAAKGGLILFDQIDRDHTGSVDRHELQRMLMSLPKNKPKPPEGGWPGGVPPKLLTFDEIVERLDTDGDGEVTLDEWLENYGKMPGLKALVDQAVDPKTGKIIGFQSLEEALVALRVEKRLAEQKVAKYAQQIESITSQIGSAGILVFRQIDIDRSGSIERGELTKFLNDLPNPGKQWDIDGIIGTLDSDKDGFISEAEWLANLACLPSLTASIEKTVDPVTGEMTLPSYSFPDRPLAFPRTEESERELVKEGEAVGGGVRVKRRSRKRGPGGGF